jgi:hypothetical protein
MAMCCSDWAIPSWMALPRHIPNDFAYFCHDRPVTPRDAKWRGSFSGCQRTKGWRRLGWGIGVNSIPPNLGTNRGKELECGQEEKSAQRKARYSVLNGLKASDLRRKRNHASGPLWRRSERDSGVPDVMESQFISHET